MGIPALCLRYFQFLFLTIRNFHKKTYLFRESHTDMTLNLAGQISSIHKFPHSRGKGDSVENNGDWIIPEKRWFFHKKVCILVTDKRIRSLLASNPIRIRPIPIRWGIPLKFLFLWLRIFPSSLTLWLNSYILPLPASRELFFPFLSPSLRKKAIRLTVVIKSDILSWTQATPTFIGQESLIYFHSSSPQPYSSSFL